MLHPSVCRDLLFEEAEVARLRLGKRIDELIVIGTDVVCVFGDYRMRLDGANYDAEPFRLSFIDAQGTTLPGTSWPPGTHSGMHPHLQMPWCCIEGTYEYHVYHGHAGNIWDRHRDSIRLADLLDHLLRRSGR